MLSKRTFIILGFALVVAAFHLFSQSISPALALCGGNFTCSRTTTICDGPPGCNPKEDGDPSNDCTICRDETATQSHACNTFPDQDCSIYVPTSCLNWTITGSCTYLPPQTPPRCGDGVCNGTDTQTNCPVDCGSPAGGGSGGSGGGSCPTGNSACAWCAGPSRDAGGCPAGNEMVSNNWCSNGYCCCGSSGGGDPTMPNCTAPTGLTGRCELYDTHMRLLWEWNPRPYSDLTHAVQFTNDPTFSSTIFSGNVPEGVNSYPSYYHDYRNTYAIGTYYLRVRTSSGNWCVPSAWGNPVALRPENCTDRRTPNAAPTVTITAPPNGSTYLEGANVTISASATDSDGTIASLSLYRGSTPIWGITNSTPSSNFSTSHTWLGIPAGNYSLTARATDNRGAVGVSSPVIITVNAMQPISGNVYIDPNATASLATGICSGTAGALSGAEGSLGVRVTNTVGGTTYNSGLTGSSWSVTTPPSSDGRYRAALLGLDPNFVCACPTGCSYTAGINSPQANVNFYLTPTADAWFQVEGGPIAAFASTGQRALNNLIPEFCSPPTCNPFLILNQNGADSEGYVLTGGSYVTGTDKIDQSGHNWVAQMSSAPDKRQDYHYFKVLSLLPTSPKSDFTPFEPIEGSVTSLDKPDKGQDFANGDQARAYFHAGEAVIDSPWSVESDEKLVVLVDGDISIEEPITVEPGGFFMLVASGDITFDARLGHTDINQTDALVEGVFVADGVLTVESADTGGDKRFIGEGTFVGWSGVDLQRDYDDGAGRRALNNVSAVEYFRYRPDFITAAPEEFMRSRYSWQQVNP